MVKGKILQEIEHLSQLEKLKRIKKTLKK